MEHTQNEPTVPLNFLKDQMAQLKELLLERFGGIESALREAEVSAEREAEQAKQIRENLTAEVGRLDTQLREKQDLLQARESAMREMEESLTGKLQELQNQLQERSQLLEKRDAELKEMRLFLNRIRDKESALNQAEALAERIKESLRVDVSRLEIQLRASGGNFHAGEAQAEENPTVKVHELETRIRVEGILEGSEAEEKGAPENGPHT
ncbi:MAG: hypothetical protein ACREP8_08600 [Candidatus Binatia bacterium]